MITEFRFRKIRSTLNEIKDLFKTPLTIVAEKRRKLKLKFKDKDKDVKSGNLEKFAFTKFQNAFVVPSNNFVENE